MFPLRQRKLIRGCSEHIKAGLSCAADYVAATGTEYFAPFTGTLSIPYGPGGQGGIWLRLTRTNGDKIEIAHLQKYVKSSGGVVEGELIAYTDNTGTLTTGPHAHIQIIDKNNKRLDPEKYDWGGQTQGDSDMYDKGVTVEALESGNVYDKPDTNSKVNATYGKGDQGEVDSVLSNPKPGEQVSSSGWIVWASAGVKYGWVEKAKFKAVPRGGFGGWEKLSAENEALKKQIADNTANQKLADAKDLAKQAQGLTSKIVGL